MGGQKKKIPRSLLRKINFFGGVMSKAKMVLGHIMWFFMCVLCGWAFADDATVLPKGISSVKIDGAYYLPIDERYNNDGHAEDAATDFNANLNSNIFPALGQIEAALGLPAGSASLGTSEVTFKYH